MELSIRTESINLASYYALMTFQLAICVSGLVGAWHDASLVLMAVMVLAGLSMAVLTRVWVFMQQSFDRDRAVEGERRVLLSTDVLTGALSRRAFMDRLRDVVRLGSRSECVLVLVDVDHFKSINDSFGHATGDQVLQHLVAVARTCFPEASICRLGGDEFAFLVETAPVADCSKACDRFLAELRLPIKIAGRQLVVGASVGLAAAPLHSAFLDELMLCADLALYESKRRGRGCATVFDVSMMQDQKHRRFIERELRAALLLDELELHYQPVIGLSGQAIGAEALVRWSHPVRGMMAPDSFVPIAEQSNLIDRLGEWVFRRACQDLPQMPGGRIAINVSGAQLQRDALVEMVERVLAESGCSAASFTFEITETIALASDGRVRARLQRLRDLGAKIALDDFGTGNCGFAMLHSFPVDVIKIDRSYIQAMAQDRVASILVSALGAIGRETNLSIVAEGIETEAHLALAKAGGCTAFQGYFLGRPMPLLQRKRVRAGLAA